TGLRPTHFPHPSTPNRQHRYRRRSTVHGQRSRYRLNAAAKALVAAPCLTSPQNGSSSRSSALPPGGDSARELVRARAPFGLGRPADALLRLETPASAGSAPSASESGMPSGSMPFERAAIACTSSAHTSKPVRGSPSLLW